MKLNRKQLRKIILKEMSDMGMPEEPVVPGVSEENVARLRQFMQLFDAHMRSMKRYDRGKPYFNDPRRIGMKIPYQMLLDQMGASVMDPEVVKQSLMAIGGKNGLMRAFKSRKTDQLIHMAKQIAREL